MVEDEASGRHRWSSGREDWQTGEGWQGAPGTLRSLGLQTAGQGFILRIKHVSGNFILLVPLHVLLSTNAWHTVGLT